MSEINKAFIVEESETGQRLDKWLAERLQDEDYDVSRSQVQTWLAEGYIASTRLRLKASGSVEAGETYQLQVPSPEPLQIVGDELELAVVYEDDDVIVIDKPRGLVVHPAVGHPRGTVINGLVHRGTQLSVLGGESRPGVVHRIDKDTSGLVMFAKTDVAYHKLADQLKEHTVIRAYAAIVHGVITHDEGTIDAPVGRDPKNRQRMAVVASGKDAITHFHVDERFTDYCAVTCRLETGRTHQIRVHFAYIDHPLAGDPVYGRRHTLAIEGQALHAKTLGFVHPTTGKPLMFESALPADMVRLMDGLRAGLL